MSGIYLHIPFCKKACTYCNFHFSTNFKLVDDILKAIHKELIDRKHYLSDSINTVYFGGGTPSVLNKHQLNQLLQTIKNNYNLNPKAEITIEVNPDDINSIYINELKEVGFNRVSMGVQSFNAAELEFMNRSHTAQQSLQSMQLIANAFENYSIDLIYGSHLNSHQVWQQNVQTALQFKPPHISCYALTVEDKTKLNAIVKKDKSLLPQPDIQAQQFEWLMDELNEAGYLHYEVSNFALPNFESKHNSAYWQGKHYLGVGPGAHSFNSVSRSWNVANNILYTKAVMLNDSYNEIEWLTPTEQQNEHIMIAIRTAKGIDLKQYEENWGANAKDVLLLRANSWVNKNLLQLKGDNLCVTQKGFLFADGIAADLFNQTPIFFKGEKKSH